MRRTWWLQEFLHFEGWQVTCPSPQTFRRWSWQCSSPIPRKKKKVTSKVWLIESIFFLSLSKPRLITFSKICIRFKLKPGTESDWCFVLTASDGKNKGGLVKLADLNSLVCTVHFVLLTEAAGDSHQTIPCGATALPIVLDHSPTNRRWRIWSSQDFDCPQMLDVVAGKVEAKLE